MNAVAQSESRALAEAPRQQFDLSPQTFEQALVFADYLAASDLVPKDFKGKPGNCLIAMQWGAEIGLKPLQAIQNIAVINGRPSLWGDAMLALVRASPLCEYVTESVLNGVAVCRVKRRGEPEQAREFSLDDAKTAGLLSKEGPWKTYPKRMLQMRARAWALRDVFTDVLKGLHMAEEAMDMPPPEKFMGSADVVGAPPPPPPPPPATYAQADFEKNLPAWLKVIASGRKTVDEIITTANTKAPLSEEQKEALRKAAAPQPMAAEAVYQQLTAADDPEKLAAAKALIERVADEAERAELDVVAQRRESELNAPKE